MFIYFKINGPSRLVIACFFVANSFDALLFVDQDWPILRQVFHFRFWVRFKFNDKSSQTFDHKTKERNQISESEKQKDVGDVSELDGGGTIWRGRFVGTIFLFGSFQFRTRRVHSHRGVYSALWITSQVQSWEESSLLKPDQVQVDHLPHFWIHFLVKDPNDGLSKQSFLGEMKSFDAKVTLFFVREFRKFCK